ncbi:HPr kinase/phosphorylase [Propylenella binzhouense]|uniref:Serine/threonine protein kinase n=1 Tax=Propylenella binzhouense TaxID=2555902 RepID=A0A964WTF0_9HYPH|nr:HPr kinase/phosphatase C-terminal domain-containing protein [Propylenella binzhouense]MYZ47962.1 serine/threonine protein kinase [Propylenella binzhouense]
MSETVHGTAVLMGASGILIRGPSGSGKSRLAAAIVERGGRLVGDDRVHLSARAGRLVAVPHGALAGLIELRGRGLLRLPYEPACVVSLVADIEPEETLARLPEPGALVTAILGVALPRQPVPGRPGQAIRLLRVALGATFGACDRTANGQDGGPSGIQTVR